MKDKKHNLKVIISGGGTGGHIFPAIAIANALKERIPEIEILFVGASSRMEMERVPKAGYNIIGLPIIGFNRKISLKTITFFFKLIVSLFKASGVIRKFKPDIAIGVGGYASGALLYMASWKNVPSLIQEQNSFPGITNKLLKNKVKKICVAYSGMEKFFPPEKIVLTGNPVRSDIIDLSGKKDEALKHFNLDKNKKTILVLGGSLGARTINQSLINNIDKFDIPGVQVLWQTGKLYIDDVRATMSTKEMKNININDFINRMDLAYTTADIIISRAGAGTISELCLVGKPCILVPSPNVSEDHQTKNAMALVDKNAAILIKDKKANKLLADATIQLMNDKQKSLSLSENISKLKITDSADRIVNEIMEIIK